MTATPQPQSSEDRLREKLHSILVVAEMDKHNWSHDSDGFFKVTEGAIMQAVKAELGAAIGKDEPETGFGKRDGEYEMHLHRNKFRAELRNHVGIGEV